MNDTASVKIADTLNELAHDFDYVTLRQGRLLKVREELAAMDFLHDDPHPSWILVYFSHFNHVRMA